MLKLTRQLFFTNPAGRDYLDYYEKALYNHILASQDPNSAHGFQCYYMPLRAGGIKTYSNDYNNFICCHGTGMESNTKYGDSIYFHDGGSTLYVNLFIAVGADLVRAGRHDPAGDQVPGGRLDPAHRHRLRRVHDEGAHPVVGLGPQIRVNGTVLAEPGARHVRHDQPHLGVRRRRRRQPADGADP